MIEFLPPTIYSTQTSPPQLLQSQRNERSSSLQNNGKEDLYPWLDKDDPCRNMTDEEILDKYIDLSNSDLTSHEKDTLM